MSTFLDQKVEEPDSVLVEEAFGEWFVRIVEDGESRVTSFELESFAEAFAAGQRIRLQQKTAGEAA